jgi:serine/threonine protein kinase/dienelactone hydrolase
MIGETISHYKIIEKLGEGGMGVVYRALDTKLEREVAIKFLPPHLSADTEATKRFIHEAKAASAIDHSHIGTIYEIDETEDAVTFIVMALYDGETLRERMDRGELNVEDSLEIASQIASGLSKAHQKDIVHRDIKPSNIIITSDREVKIIDFGLAKLAGRTRLTKEASTLGTAAYMSPEQARGEEADHRSDIFSLGVILYEMLAGKPPFKGEHEAALLYEIVHEEYEPVTSGKLEVPEAMDKIMQRSLSKVREARYESAVDFLDDLEAIRKCLQFEESRTPVSGSLFQLLRQPRFSIPGIILLLAIGLLFLRWRNRQARVRWARQVILPEIERLAQDIPWTGEGPQTWIAFELAIEATRYIPDDPMLIGLWPRFSRYAKIDSDPSGIDIYAKPYSDLESDWRHIGQTPIVGIRFPSGYSRVKLKKDGFRTSYDLAWSMAWLSDTLKLHYRLPEIGILPEEMELVPDKLRRLSLPGLDHFEARGTGDFLMDRHEVTNEAYKRFIDNDGYISSEYWIYPFVREGRTLSWKEALKFFTDKTGRPGPATWEAGDYPDGEKNYPVSGVSWYEAAAYAVFAGKELPTIYHWDRAAKIPASPEIVPLSNMGKISTVSVGSSRSMNRFGICDMAGNVREWCFNKNSRGEERFILGGGWNDPAYAFEDAYAQNPFDRSVTNGFRCIKYFGSENTQADLKEPILLPFRDFLNEPKVSEETFTTFLKQYAYDKTELDVVIESVKEEEDWIKEKITFNAAYGNERIIAYLFLPKNGTPPFQTVIYFPGSSAIHFHSSESNAIPFHHTLSPGSRAFLAKNGRAVLYPVYKSTFERGDDLKSDFPDETYFYKEHVIMWIKDLSRSIDYLETRDDIEIDKLAYFGYSWGSNTGAIVASVEKRLKVSVLLVGGLYFQRSLPEVDPIHYLPRVTIPVLMLNGRYDFFYPYETSQLPFFKLLGTSKEDKELLAYEMSHIVPRTDLIKETLVWLDRYLGPVE